MKVLLFAMILNFSSCALMNDLDFGAGSFTSFNYDNVSVGLSITDYQEVRRLSDMKIALANKKMYLYRDGYVTFENDKVVDRGNYDVNIASEENLSTYLKTDIEIWDAVKILGQPVQVEYEGDNLKLFYNRGAVLTKQGKVLAVADKNYTDVSFGLKINAFTSNSVSKEHAYFIVPGSEKVNPEDFQFKEAKSFIKTSLESDGFKVTENPKLAKYIVFVNFGISDPKEDIQIVSKPVYIPQYIPGSNYNFYGSAGSFLGSARTSGTWSSQYAGQRIETYKTVSYSRWLNIEAVDYEHLQKTKEIKPVWKILTQSIGTSGDLRFVLPALCYGAGNFIDKDTLRQKDYSVGSGTLNNYVYLVKFNNVQSRDIASKK